MSQLVLRRDHVLVDTVGLGVETPTQVPYYLLHKEGLCICGCTRDERQTLPSKEPSFTFFALKSISNIIFSFSLNFFFRN